LGPLGIRASSAVIALYPHIDAPTHYASAEISSGEASASLLRAGNSFIIVS
jgi:hypothetical protein